MYAYAIINSDTNIIKSHLYWRDNPIADNYPIEANEYILPLTEDIYRELSSNTLIGKTYKIKDINGGTFQDLLEEVNLIVVQEPIVDQEKLAMAEAIADLYEQILVLQGGV